MKKLAFAAVVLCLTLYALTVFYDRGLERDDPAGYRNLKTCSRLPPGIGEGQLLAALGEPTRRTPSNAGELLEFRTLNVAATPIRAEIDGASRRVLALWCRDDQQPAWRAGKP